MKTHEYVANILSLEERVMIHYIPSIFQHVSSPVKCTLEVKVSDYSRREGAKKRRMTEVSKQQLAKETRQREKMWEAERQQLAEIQRERHNAEVQQRKSDQLKQASELEEQQAAEMARQFEDLKATIEALKKANKELATRCAGLGQQLSEVCREIEKLEEKVVAMFKQVLNEAKLKDGAKKVKYYTGLPSIAALKAIYIT